MLQLITIVQKNDLNMYIDDLKVVKSNEYSRELNNITISKNFFL